jgi:hypothetical protein
VEFQDLWVNMEASALFQEHSLWRAKDHDLGEDANEKVRD